MDVSVELLSFISLSSSIFSQFIAGKRKKALASYHRQAFFSHHAKTV